MSLNFAPYSSPPSSPRASTSRLPPSSSSTSRPKAKAPWFGGGSYSYHSGSRPAEASSAGAGATGFGSSGDGYGYESAPSGDVLWDAEAGGAPQTAGPSSGAGPSAGHDAYETTYGWRVDIEAGVAYVLGPVLGIVLLMLEHKNDYVRFHAWQSLLLGCVLAVLHILFLWSRFFSWIIFLADVAIYGQMTYRAFVNGNTLERYYLPRIGELATQWVDEE